MTEPTIHGDHLTSEDGRSSNNAVRGDPPMKKSCATKATQEKGTKMSESTADENMANTDQSEKKSILREMPWTRDRLRPEELQAWLATRKDAGCAIDIEACEVAWCYACDFDPYDVIPDLPEELQVVSRNYYVRSGDSCGWISKWDLPEKKVKTLDARFRRMSGLPEDDEIPMN
jgi:hypothetical protein